MLYAATSMAAFAVRTAPGRLRLVHVVHAAVRAHSLNRCACLRTRRRPSPPECAPKLSTATSVCFLNALPFQRADYSWLPRMRRFREEVVTAQPHALAIFPPPHRCLEPTSPMRTMPHIPNSSVSPILASHRDLLPLPVPSPSFNQIIPVRPTRSRRDSRLTSLLAALANSMSRMQ
jgi:hypothetical protein